MTLIGLGFTARVGKTYASSLLRAAYPDRTVVVLAFADAVKEGLRPVLEGSGIDPFTEDPEQKKILRPLLVAYGEFWRAVDKDHWMDLVMGRVDALISCPVCEDTRFAIGETGALLSTGCPLCCGPNAPIVVVPDVRYQNEAQAVLDRRGCVVHVKAAVEPANDVERRNALLCAGMASVEVFNDFGPGFGPRLLGALAPWLPPRSSSGLLQPATSGVLPAKTPPKASEVAR